MGGDRTRQAAPDAAIAPDELQTLLWARLDELYSQAVDASESSQALQAQAAHQARRSRDLFREARATLAEIRRRRDAFRS